MVFNVSSGLAFASQIISAPLANFISSSISNYIDNKKKKKVNIQIVVLPSGSGKTSLVKRFTEEFGLNSNVILLDLEDAVFQDPTIPSEVKSQLQSLKYSDPHRFEITLFPLAKSIMATTLQHLIDVKSNKHLVVLVSTVALKRALNLTNAFYFAPSKMLFDTLVSANPGIKNALLLSRDILDGAHKAIQIFKSFDELYEMFLITIDIKRNI